MTSETSENTIFRSVLLHPMLSNVNSCRRTRLMVNTYIFSSTEKEASYMQKCKSDNAFRFPRFLVPSQQRNHGKYFYCHGKYLAKENFRAPAWTSAKRYCENKTGNPEQAVSLNLARSGSQSHSAGFGSSCPLAELAI